MSTLGKPILQIVHISDLHFHVGGAPQDDRFVRRMIRAIARINPDRGRWLQDYWEDGRAGHAADALLAFRCFLTGDAMPHEPKGRQHQAGVSQLLTKRIPTWLVDTGDMASVGDDASIAAQKSWVDQMGQLMGAIEVVRIYGNHDAWPNKFPLASSKGDIVQHRNNLRTRFFPADHPQQPVSIPIGASGNCIDMYALNSVTHNKWMNTRAHGHIKNDPHWQHGAQNQLNELSSLVAARARSGRAFRILLSHHPVHYPAPKPSWTMSLINDQQVANALVGPTGTGPLAHLILSGHTHRLYPTHGGLPPNAGTPRHPPLGFQQLQLIVGSLSKAVRVQANGGENPVDDQPHQCQVLRFFELPGNPLSLVIKRAIITRKQGTGRFALLEVKEREHWETTIINY